MSTIAAISTAQGEGGIGIIRISGSNSAETADKVFRSVSGKTLVSLEGYRALFGHIVRNGEVIDEAVALRFKAPHSFTGEDVVELSCHGGLYLTREVLSAVLEAGAVPAEPGEFTKRAFLNGKMDLTQAESVMDLISAKSRSAARAAMYVKEGTLFKKAQAVKESLLNTAAHLSAWADYPEEDIPEVGSDAVKGSVGECLAVLEDLLASYDMGQAVKEGIETVLIGRPNAGKSTLMNLLSGRERSIVTAIEGTTRDVIEDTVTVGNVILRLSDTAGIRETENEIEKIGVERTLQKLSQAGLVIAVFDMGRPLSEEDIQIIDKIKDLPSIAVINKTDLAPSLDTEYITDRIKNAVFISAKNEENIDELRTAIERLAGTENFDPSAGIIANERQRNAVLASAKSLNEALTALDFGFTMDAVTVSITEAIDHLMELTGEKAGVEIVDRVFHNFCVGK